MDTSNELLDNSQLGERMQVNDPDSVRPFYLNQTVVMDVDLSEDLRKFIPQSQPQMVDSTGTPDAWTELEPKRLEPLRPGFFAAELRKVATDGMKRFYHIHDNTPPTVPIVFVYDEDGKELESFAEQKRITDLSVDSMGTASILDGSAKEISIYSPDRILESRFRIPFEPSSFLHTPPFTFKIETPLDDSFTGSGKKNTSWPIQLQGAISFSPFSSYLLEFPNNGKKAGDLRDYDLGAPYQNGDYALIPSTAEIEDEFGERTMSKLKINNQFTLSFSVIPALREDFIIPENGDIQCTHNLISSKDFGVGLIVWKDSVGKTKSFFRLSVPGGGSYTSKDQFNADQEYRIQVVKGLTSYSLYITGGKYKNEGVPIDTGSCDFVSKVEPSDIYIGGDMPAATHWQKIRFAKPGANFDTPEDIPHLPHYFFAGKVSDIQIIPSSLSNTDLKIFTQPNLSNYRMIEMNENRVCTVEHKFNKLIVMDHRGVLKKNVDIPGLAPTDSVTAISMDTSGAVYLVINESGRILKYTNEDNWNEDWLAVPKEKITRLFDIKAHESGFVYLAYTGANRGIMVCDSDGQLMFDLNVKDESLSFTTEIAIASSGEIYTDQHYCYRPRIGHHLTADLRGKIWKMTCVKLLTELNYARSRYNNQQRFYAMAKENYKNQFDVDSNEVSSYNQSVQSSLEMVQEEEGNWENFKDFLFANGINTHGTEKEISQRVDAYYRRQKFLLQYMQNYLRSIDSKTEVRTYARQDGHYIDQFGMSLEQHVRRISNYPDAEILPVIILPIDNNDMESGRVLILTNPSYSGKKVNPTSCVFKEEYKMDLSWLGISLGEYNHSINLLPGESRDIKATTKRTQTWETSYSSKSKSEQKRSGEKEKKVKKTNDFETKLHDELEHSRNSIDEVTTNNNSTSKSEMKLDLNFGIPKIGLGFNADSNSDITKTLNHNKHYKKSLDTVSKRVKDIVKKTSTEISEQNKVSFSETNTSETSTTRKDSQSITEEHVETIRVHNPNMGRTANYHFFQIQNQYGTEVHVENAEFYFDTGIEILSGTGITLQYNYSLDSFPRLASDLNAFSKSDKRKIIDILTAFVLRRYVRVGEEAMESSPRILRAAKRLDRGLDGTQIRQLREAIAMPIAEWRDNEEITGRLREMSDMVFNVTSTLATTMDEFAVNSGRFFADSQVGVGEAVEDYLSNRRNIETATRKAEVEKIRERTKQGKFLEELPDGLTHLNYDKKE